VSPRAGLDNMEKLKFLTLLGLELQPLSYLCITQKTSDLVLNLNMYSTVSKYPCKEWETILIRSHLEGLYNIQHIN
jgi:hypothetical protein